MIRILLVDDHQIVLDGLHAVLQTEPAVEIVGQALSGSEAEETLKGRKVDVVLLDINLPDQSGFQICKAFKIKYPDLKIIALTMHGESGYIAKMIKVGVDGYVLKNAGKEEIMQAVKAVMTGERFFSKEVTENLLAGQHQPRATKSTDFIQKLTRREKEILKLITEEYTTDQIAEKLFISSTTVISHRKSLLRKLNAKNTAGLVKAAYEFGLLK